MKVLRVPLADLEEALRNPGAFIRQQPQRKAGFGPTRYLALRSVALSFHKLNDLDAAVDLLEARLQKFKTTAANDSYVEKLREYVSNFEGLGTTVARVRSNIKVPLPPEYADFQVTGQVARLDVDPAGGYRAWLLSNKAEKWGQQLRFPLIQSACAKQLGVDVEEIVPGVYDFSTGTYTVVRSDKARVQRARRRVVAMLDAMKTVTP